MSAAATVDSRLIAVGLSPSRASVLDPARHNTIISALQVGSSAKPELVRAVVQQAVGAAATVEYLSRAEKKSRQPQQQLSEQQQHQQSSTGQQQPQKQQQPHRQRHVTWADEDSAVSASSSAQVHSTSGQQPQKPQQPQQLQQQQMTGPVKVVLWVAKPVGQSFTVETVPAAF